MISRTPRTTTRTRSMLLKCFAQDKTAAMAAQDCKVNRHTADLWYRHWRETIYTSLRVAPRFFGDVEMDQKAFGGRGRKRMQAYLKRLKNTLTHSEYLAKAKVIRAEHKVQVFGILMRGGHVYTHIINKADKRTLMPIVRLVVEQGATVYTDAWRGFSELGLDTYTHRSVNHSLEYTDKQGNHINGIESFWSFASRRLAKFNGIPSTTLPLHLKECEFRYNNKDVLQTLKQLLRGPAPTVARRSTRGIGSKTS